MTLTRGPKRKAWVIIADTPRPPYQDRTFGGVPPGVPLAVFPSRTSKAVIQRVVDAFVQNFASSASDMADYLKKGGAPYKAEVHALGQEVMGGYNPYVEAIQVDDLRVVTDTETGAEYFEFTRRPPFGRSVRQHNQV